MQTWNVRGISQWYSQCQNYSDLAINSFSVNKSNELNLTWNVPKTCQNKLSAFCVKSAMFKNSNIYHNVPQLAGIGLNFVKSRHELKMSKIYENVARKVVKPKRSQI
ncbi:hypothetical protein O6H91_10G029400 [Diphasiastrum complanatum]|uniref:Uncharacterized protein n=1 Tax=Diphasiastrum complanatum TaxID=34168 RepID=A0ACC2CFI6_DIPCM|nr:hypothetical protein O6H91_10G029400 [Diphasiastrum complanatum]